MRIIAGQYRSRTLEAPAGLGTRPTSDRLRETLFNVLAPRIEGAAFLDLYAGSGAVGLEALSRGAAQVEFVERAPAALKFLRGNLERLGISTGFHIHAVAAGAFLRRAAEAPKRERDEVGFSTRAVGCRGGVCSYAGPAGEIRCRAARRRRAGYRRAPAQADPRRLLRLP